MTPRVAALIIPFMLLPVMAAGCSSADIKRDTNKVETEAVGRQMYSPSFRSDPYLQAKWDASARMLEAECVRSGRYCTEAKNAREAMQKLPRAGQSQ